MAFQARADYQDKVVGWLRKGCSSLGGGMVVQFPRILMSFRKCRFMHVVRKKLTVAACLVAILAVMSACQATTRQKAASLTPITVPEFEETRPIAFKKIVLKIPRNKSIGQVRVGLLCIPTGNLTRSGGRYALSSSVFNDVFREELENANYKVVGDPDQLFGDPELSKAEYFIAGLIKEIEANVCYPLAGFGDVTSSSAGVYMEVEWQIYDTLRRQVVLKLSTEGSAQTTAVPGGVAIAFENAFAQAAQNLLAQNEFYELVRFGTGASYAAITGFANINKDELRIEEGNGIDPDFLTKSTAVIRSPQGHGSGFLITSDILLTNQHVVGAATKVKVIFGDGIEIIGQVVATEPIRDVALVQIGMRGKPPLSLDLRKPKIGATVYSYGAPLDEELQGTLRKGIISAYRKLNDGQEYLQSDVAVNPGNSGGPLLDEKGNVIGVAVKGRFDGGAPQSINFFIPILDALENLGISLEGTSTSVHPADKTGLQAVVPTNRARSDEAVEGGKARNGKSDARKQAEIKRIESYIERNRSSIVSMLSDYNERHMVAESSFWYKVRSIYKYKILELKGKLALVLFGFETGDTNDIGAGGTSLNEMVFELQWINRELEIVGHRKTIMVPSYSS
ncbi:MAG: serine protease [Proteobacteria bacterium]|nr:serine protease [Pseudomonadota bacterium]